MEVPGLGLFSLLFSLSFSPQVDSFPPLFFSLSLFVMGLRTYGGYQGVAERVSLFSFCLLF